MKRKKEKRSRFFFCFKQRKICFITSPSVSLFVSVKKITKKRNFDFSHLPGRTSAVFHFTPLHNHSLDEFREQNQLLNIIVFCHLFASHPERNYGEKKTVNKREKMRKIKRLLNELKWLSSVMYEVQTTKHWLIHSKLKTSKMSEKKWTKRKFDKIKFIYSSLTSIQ